jgi:hypothetical protein
VIDVNFSRLQNPPAASIWAVFRLTRHDTYSTNFTLWSILMRTLSTQETLAVTGAHKRPRGTKPAPTMPTMPATLPKIDITALITKIKAILATLPTKPTLPTPGTTTVDTGEVVSEDAGEDVTA